MEFNYKNEDRLMEERKIEKKKFGLFLAVPFIFLLWGRVSGSPALSQAL